MKKGAVIGVGAIGPIHTMALEERGSLYAICDNQPDRLARWEPENTDIKRYSNFEDVLKDENVDVVHICTPHYLHTEMAIKALNAGKDVVLEKPLALNHEELDRLLETARNSKNKVCVMFQNRTNPATKMLKSLLDNGCDLGALQGISATIVWCRDAEYYAQDEWRGKIKTEGGGLLINQAIHTLDTLGHLGGKIKKIRGSVSNKMLEGIIEVEDTADAIMETESGMRITFYGTNGNTFSTPPKIDLQMEKGLLRYSENRLYKITDNDCQVLIQDNAKNPGKDCWGSGHKIAINEFYEHLETGEGTYITIEDAVPAMKTLLAFYESAKTNKEVVID